MWYAVLVNDLMWAVQWFDFRPSIYDFGIGLNSRNKYEVVRVEIRVLGPG